jgi:hypothetical protein
MVFAHVDGLADEHVARFGEVDADLVLVFCLEAALDERRAAQALERAHVRDGVLRVGRWRLRERA